MSSDSSKVFYKQTEWLVSLESKATVILAEEHEDLNNTTTSKTVTSASLVFNDESTAKRVQEAFNHAANLCRKQKEPF